MRPRCFGGLVLFLVFVALACAGPSRLVVKPQSDVDLIFAAEQAFQRKRYEEAVRYLQQLLNQFPESELVPDARLGVGRVYFQQKKYDEARAEYLRFLELFPQHERADEARYFMGLSYFRQMNGADRDQSFTQRALAEFQTILVQMPDSPYVSDAAAKARVCLKRLAEQELFVGTFYFRQGRYSAAIGRFDTILKGYPGMGLDDEALYLKAESLWRLEQKERAKEVFVRLLEEYPHSRFAVKAARRMGVPAPQVAGQEGPGGLSGLLAKISASLGSLLDLALFKGQ